MCGIAGVVSYQDAPTTADLHTMARFLHHRGPDAQSIWQEGTVGLAHTRLSIIDLTPTGAQPMVHHAGHLVIVFNGEIYNYRELRNELLRLRHHFVGQSDTEVIMAAYLQWGLPEMLQRMNGMFAFALLDKRTGKVLLARDRFGKKPLFYAQNTRGFYFSSDIRSVAHLLPRLTINLRSLDYYFTELASPQPLTIFEEIQQVKPAHWLEVDIRHAAPVAQEQRYWKLDYSQKLKMSETECLEQLDIKLRDAVVNRTIADVPLGAFLSGGIDSGLVTALYAQYTNKSVKTFTVGFAESEYNEIPLARKVAERYGTEHTEILVSSQDLTAIMPKLVEELGEPFADSSAIPTYHVCKSIRGHVTVALSGDGGDELFGGYHNYVSAWQYDRYYKKDLPGWLQPVCRGLNMAARKLGISNYNYGNLDAFHGLNAEMKLGRNMGFRTEEHPRLFRPEYAPQIPAYGHEILERALKEAQYPSMLDNIISASMNHRLLNDYLVKIDRISMYASLEVRSPLLDYHLAEFMAQVPNELILNKGISKYLLKKLAARYLDADIFSRIKKGFTIPMERWLRADLKPMADEVVADEGIGLLNNSFVQQFWLDFQNRKHNRSDAVWTVLMWKLWIAQAKRQYGSKLSVPF